MGDFAVSKYSTFGSPSILSESCAPFGVLCYVRLRSGFPPASERPFGILCSPVGPLRHLGSTRIPLGDLLLHLSPIRASLAANPEVFLHHPHLEGTILVATWFLRSIFSWPKWIGSWPKGFCKEVKHLHGDLILAASWPFLLLCSMLFGFACALS